MFEQGVVVLPETNRLQAMDGRHAGEDLWVVGSDASIDYFPKGFFENRTVVCVNQIHVPCQYVVSKADVGQLADSVYLEKNVQSQPGVMLVVSKYSAGLRAEGEVLLHGPNVIVFDHEDNMIQQFDAVRDIPADPSMMLVSHSTLGSAMHFAARLGARTVFMVGVSGGAFAGRKSLESRGNHSAGFIDRMSRQTQPIANRLTEMYGTEFVTVLPWANLRCDGVNFSSDYGQLN
jgi:hypothetical protein